MCYRPGAGGRESEKMKVFLVDLGELGDAYGNLEERKVKCEMKRERLRMNQARRIGPNGDRGIFPNGDGRD